MGNLAVLNRKYVLIRVKATKQLARLSNVLSDVGLIAGSLATKN